MTKSCPYCGSVVDDHIGKCPKCGLDFANRPAQATPSTSSSPGSPGGFPTAPDPFSSPGIWNPSKGQPVLQPVRTGNAGRRIAIAFAAMVVVAGLVAGFLYVTRKVADELDRPPPNGAFPGTEFIPRETDNGNGKGSGKGGGPGNKNGPAEVANSRELYRLMNRNGAKCTGFNKVVATAQVDTASCFAGTEAWTILVFFQDIAYDAVVSNYIATDAIDVAYGGNWTVIVQSEKSAKRIARALGGEWS